MLIKDMKKDDKVAGYYLIRSLEIKTSKGGEYFDLTLMDLNSASIIGRVWNIKDADKATYKRFDIIFVGYGLVDLYEGKLQVVISNMRKSEEDGHVPTDFIRKAPIAPHELMSYIDNVVSSITHYVPRTILQRIIDRYRDKLAIYPAAMGHHHDYYSGLAYHMSRMLDLGDFICRKRSFLVQDYIKFGIVGHDLGKLAEMVVEESLGIAIDISDEGRLVGHIGIMHKWLIQEAVALGMSLESKVFIQLEHLILSHHGKKEFGSPIEPQTPEAIALHQIDVLDAKLQVAEDSIDTMTDAGTWSPRIKNFGYISIMKTEDPNQQGV
jgi:3'-5' exoribonuclease